jgi:hypothetical protein
MKKIFTLALAAVLLLTASQESFAQKKKKEKKSKVTVHGEKDNDGKFNERKDKGGTAKSGKSKKSKKSKKSTTSIKLINDRYFVLYFREDEEGMDFA